jgi:hypothetical protein
MTVRSGLALGLLLLGAPGAAYAEGEAQPAPTEDPCRETIACARHGRCSSDEGRCVALDEADCAASSTCQEHGLRCELDAAARRCGGSASDEERLSHEPPAGGIDRRGRDLAIGFVLCALGIGAGIATPFFLEAVEAGDADPLEAAALVASGVGTFGLGVTFITLGARGPSAIDGAPAPLDGAPTPLGGAVATVRLRF